MAWHDCASRSSHFLLHEYIEKAVLDSLAQHFWQRSQSFCGCATSATQHLLHQTLPRVIVSSCAVLRFHTSSGATTHHPVFQSLCDLSWTRQDQQDYLLSSTSGYVFESAHVVLKRTAPLVSIKNCQTIQLWRPKATLFFGCLTEHSGVRETHHSILWFTLKKTRPHPNLYAQCPSPRNGHAPASASCGLISPQQNRGMVARRRKMGFSAVNQKETSTTTSVSKCLLRGDLMKFVGETSAKSGIIGRNSSIMWWIRHGSCVGCHESYVKPNTNEETPVQEASVSIMLVISELHVQKTKKKWLFCFVSNR